MGITFRRIRSFVQKLAKIAALSNEERTLAVDVVTGISATGSCKVSDIARAKGGEGPLRELTQPFYRGLSKITSGLDRLREAWVLSSHRSPTGCPLSPSTSPTSSSSTAIHTTDTL